MKILITGGCDFVGTNNAIFLNTKDYEVNTLDNYIRKGSRYNFDLLKKYKIKNFNIDIRNVN